MTVLAVAVAVFGFAEDADAHGGVVLTLHGDGAGSVWVTAVWEDGHPVTEPIGMTMLATSGTGQRVGPAPLKRNGDAVTYSGTLTPGEWTVVADMGTPAIGRCEGVLHVAAAGATPAPDEKKCSPPPVSAAAAPPSGTSSSVSFSWIWYSLGAIAVLGALGFLFFRPARQAPKKRTKSRKARR
ncbi:hypothetical protein Dvina_11215 [Dactylosporangium vinaceum]|uniref:YtkA-like domain-containing protein n=1 Tax=Dactylosporangium vinaceum TaxID=53362 RepID=A0ABV5MMY3_9ACTN|nr:hypothetical protein [Dactylosporangium vinaceum]UAB98599.1 hypothetical protein Dvina_11215 [Dactylosporangium vinaceum]